MTFAKSPPLTLEDFLKLPETKPRNKHIDGHVIPKSMPKSHHSRPPGKLINAINEVSESEQIVYAFPKLQCTFGERSIVPDIAVFLWQRIVLGENGEPLDDVWIAPDWIIEILSPDQSSNRVTGNILHCLRHGCRLGWLIDPEDYSVMIFLTGSATQFVARWREMGCFGRHSVDPDR